MVNTQRAAPRGPHAIAADCQSWQCSTLGCTLFSSRYCSAEPQWKSKLRGARGASRGVGAGASVG